MLIIDYRNCSCFKR